MRLPVVLTRDEARALLNQPNRRVPTGLRNYAMMAVMMRAGLRVGEVLALKSDHIDWVNGAIRVEKGKGGKDRVLYVEPWVIDALSAWMNRQKVLSLRPGWGISKRKKDKSKDDDVKGLVFTTLEGAKLQDKYIRTMVKREAQDAGITKDVHPHTLRHTFATQLLDDGFNLVEVQEMLGHAYLETTRIYLHTNPVHLRDKVRARAM